jgi:hypothetical protein
MHVLYLTFGNNLKNHTQAHFSIYSLLAQGAAITGIHVMTDYPDFYQSLGDHIEIIRVNEEQLTAWKGPHDFFWRIKIKAIETICRQYPGEPVLYLDSDTFAYQNLALLQDTAAAGTARMHEWEKALPDAKSKTEKRMWQQIAGKRFGNVTIQPAHAMWNAGVVLVPNRLNGEDCALALAICDEMCAQQVTRRLIEQYALAVALYEKYDLQPAVDYIAHYWSNKPGWDSLIEQFFISAAFKGLSFGQTTAALRQLDLSSIPIKQEIPNTNSRLQGLVNKLFPARHVTYVKK